MLTLLPPGSTRIQVLNEDVLLAVTVTVTLWPAASDPADGVTVR
jgi:hypothetical protein